MAQGRLVIGNKRFSSWSMRGWLAVHLSGLDVTEEVIRLRGGPTPEVKAATGGATVPYLEHDGNVIWESLAICEYCAELNPRLWPLERVPRTVARVISAEMHAGFVPLRREMSMDLCRDDLAGKGRTPEALENVARIEKLWATARRRFGEGGPYLFGAAFTAADAMYAPVVTRFLTYRPELSADTWAYCEAVRAHPLVARWYDEARAEPAEWGALHG